MQPSSLTGLPPRRGVKRPKGTVCGASRIPAGRRSGPALLILALVMGAVQAGQPYTPADDATVVERLPAGLLSGSDQLAQLRRQAAAAPDDPAAAAALARGYIRLGRAEADPRYYGYAQAALHPWWEQQRPPSQVRLLRAVIRQARHEFAPALADLDALLTEQPALAQAWLSRAVILQVQGRLAAALQSCTRLSGLADPLVRATCLASVAGSMGRAEAAYRLLQQHLSRSDAEPALRLWALTVQGELAWALGWEQAAEAAFRQALSLGLRDSYLLGAYADLLLEQGRAAEVKQLLADETRADGLLLRLALAEQDLSHPDLIRHRALIRDRMAAARRRGDDLHSREAARATLHLFDDPPAALALALDNWRVQREPQDARLVLEAALAAGRPAAARPVLDWLATTGNQHRTLVRLSRQLREGERNAR